MGSTNKTDKYKLPQFIDTDKPSWLGDMNDAFLKIDDGIVQAYATAESSATSGGQALTIAKEVQSSNEELQMEVGQFKTKIEADISVINNKNTTQDDAITNAQSTANNAQATASASQTSANNAQSTANEAKSLGTNAQSRADSAYSLASSANTSANDALAKTKKGASGALTTSSQFSNASGTRELRYTYLPLGDGLLKIEGVVLTGSSVVENAILTTVPSGVRPSKNIGIPSGVIRKDNNGNVITKYMSVNTNGQVIINTVSNDTDCAWYIDTLVIY